MRGLGLCLLAAVLAGCAGHRATPVYRTGAWDTYSGSATSATLRIAFYAGAATDPDNPCYESRRLTAAGALGVRGKRVPQIAITISEPALHDRPGALPARATSGAVWPATLVRRMICDSAITRFVLSLGHRVIETSHTERTLKPHERRIKQIETGGVCQGAGCGRGDHTRHRLIPHHPTPYAINPITSLGDTVLLCDLTHADLHDGDKTIRLKDGRRLGPHGWVDRNQTAA